MANTAIDWHLDLTPEQEKKYVEKIKAEEKNKRLAQREAIQKASQEIQVRQLELSFPEVFPVVPNDSAPINNFIARSTVFAPIKRGERKSQVSELKYKTDSVELRVSGQQLDIPDQDLFLELMIGLQGQGKDTLTLRTTGYKLLTGLSKTPSGGNYQWLNESLDRFVNTTLIFYYGREGTRRRKHSFALVLNNTFDEATDEMVITFHPKTLTMFAEQQFAFINKRTRLLFKKKVDLCKWLQNYFSTNRKNVHQQISLKKLHETLDNYGGNFKTFKFRLKIALKELTDSGELKVGYIENDILHYIRPSGKEIIVMAQEVRELKRLGEAKRSVASKKAAAEQKEGLFASVG